MPPNLLVKAAFVRGELENLDKTSCNEKDRIRTDFILHNAFSCVIQDTYKYEAIPAKNQKEEFVLKELEDTLNAFRTSYRENIRNLCLELDVSEENIQTVISGVSSELFGEGITWSRMIALFVFVGELTLLCLSRKFPSTIVHKIYHCFSTHVQETLICWVDDHGGWEGLTTLSIKQLGGNANTLEASKAVANSVETSKSSDSGWTKSLLHGTVRVVGTLARIANSNGHTLP